MGDITISPKNNLIPTKFDNSLIAFSEQIINGVYDNSLIHRVIPDYLIQGGELDENLIPKTAYGSMDIDYNKLTESFKDTVSLTRTSSNNSPGFFINLDYNSDLDTINQYQIIGKLRRNDKTQLTIENILQQNRIKSSFPGPNSSALATTYLKFSGILSTQTKDALGNPVHELKGLKIYDDNGDERELNLDFKLETVSEFSIV